MSTPNISLPADSTIATRTRIGKNFLWKTAAEASKGLMALYFILLARRLDSSEFGRFSVGFSMAMMISGLGDFGLNTILTRQAASDRSRGASFFIQGAYLKTLFFLGLFALGTTWPPLGFSRLTLTLFLGVAFCRNVIDQLSFFSLAHEKIIIEAKIKFLSAICSLLFTALALTRTFTVEAAAAALLGAHAIAIAAGFCLIYRELPARSSQWPKLSLPPIDSRELFAMVLFSTALAGFSRIDITLLKWLQASPSEIGRYFAAERVIATLCMLPGFLAISSLPVFSNGHVLTQSHAIRRLRRELFIAGSLAGILLWLAQKPLVAIIYGSEFLETQRLLARLCFALPFMFVNHFSLIALIANKDSWRAARATCLAFSLNVALDCLLIPRWGTMGAAWGAVAAQIVVSAQVWSLFPKRTLGAQQPTA